MSLPHPSDLLPPSQPSFSSLLSSLKRSTLSIHNRLTSIRADAEFVSRVEAAFGPRRPLVANERCGSWYIPPRDKDGSAYFKSTDGHERAWKFSTRRLNMHLVEMIETNDGIIVVDSTRRGKRMPDALSTTIPIWCAVLNRALLPDHPLSSQLFLPPYLPPSTHSQITALIPSFVASLRALNLSLPTCLTKPLRPFWITQDSFLAEEPVDCIFEDYRPIICCTASRRVVGGSEMDEGGYIQGAADDTENWAHGLTPVIFWSHSTELLETPEAELPSLIAQLVKEYTAEQNASEQPTTKLTSCISVCPLPMAAPEKDEICHIALTTSTTDKTTWVKSPKYMEIGLGKSKTASRNLRLALPDICRFASKFLAAQGSSAQIIIACESGRDLSVATALALFCYFFDEQDNFRVPDDNVSFTKTQIKIKLASIMTAYPGANPNRATLQSVNSFLMDWKN
ncbi:tRNA A64-2'-O-ribosylphosphate transferase [Stachybotrys elegans]|uniref:tRNA A64-2'-O-ribosylphosphate transferase n=1 Tax=Stachybotrys elegans TaxID=80388 RepID=A0A8K0SRC5_9HYPO|nr:tRNA A64-2'-O-ribosylphosphate transferase [Stachybotrys elegans]